MHTYLHSLVLEQHMQGTAVLPKAGEMTRTQVIVAGSRKPQVVPGRTKTGRERLICSWGGENFLEKAPCVMGLKETPGHVHSSILRRQSSKCAGRHAVVVSFGCLVRCMRWGQCGR